MLTAVISGCVTSSPVLRSGGSSGPAVVALVSPPSTTKPFQHVVASGIPRPEGRVITAKHVLRKFPKPHGVQCIGDRGDEKYVYEIGFPKIDEERHGEYARDVGWIRTPCRFDHFDRLTSTAPPPGTRVWISGYPGVVFADIEFREGGPEIQPSVIEGVVAKSVAGMPVAATGSVAVEIDDVWAADLNGFSGGPCAYRNDDHEWIVFGVAAVVRGDAHIELFGMQTAVRIGPRKALLYVAPLPIEIID